MREEILEEIKKCSGLYGYVANNYYKLTKEELKELLLNAIYVADDDQKIINETIDRNS